MNRQSYLALLLVGGLLTFFYFNLHHNMHSQIVGSEQELRFYFANTYQIHDSQLLIRYDPNDKPYDQQIAKWEQQCRRRKGTKLNLLQSEDGTIVGAFNTDLCWDDALPYSQLTAFSFSLNSTERLLFFTDRSAKMRKSEKPGFIFGKSVWFRPKADGTGVEGCFHKNNTEMGRMMTWLNSGPGQCFTIRKLEQFWVDVDEAWNVQSHFDEYLEEGQFGDGGDDAEL